MRNLSHDLHHYLVLISIFVVGLLSFILFSYDKSFQVATAVATSIAYVCWGIIHHAIHKDLYLATLIEYVSFAALGLAIIFSLIFQS